MAVDHDSSDGAASSQEREGRKKRRRLFSRRELRHQGTSIVRVGSANVLQTNRGPYSFASAKSRYETSESSQQARTSQDVFPDRESIESFTESAAEQAADTEPDELSQQRQGKLKRVNGFADRLVIGSVRRVAGVASLTSRRLRLSSKPPRRPAQCVAENISPPSSPLKLPPPLDLDRGIMSFPQTPPLARSTRSTAPTRPALSSGGRSAQSRHLHLTPLRLARDRLKPAAKQQPRPPPVFDIDGLVSRRARSSVSKKSFVL